MIYYFMYKLFEKMAEKIYQKFEYKEESITKFDCGK